MTRTVPSPLQSHLDGATTSTATLWTITRRDGAVLRFTDHDRDIVFGGDSYVASVGYQRSDISGSATMSVDSLDLQGILNSAHISETDLRGGRYNYAALRISLVNWADPDGGGETSLAAGWLGEVIFDETSGAFTAQAGFFIVRARRAAWPLAAPPALGQRLCMAREALLSQLYLHALEQPVAVALAASGNVIEVLASDDGATWTIISTGPSGLSCVVQTGEFWQPVERAAPSNRS